MFCVRETGAFLCRAFLGSRRFVVGVVGIELDIVVFVFRKFRVYGVDSIGYERCRIET